MLCKLVQNKLYTTIIHIKFSIKYKKPSPETQGVHEKKLSRTLKSYFLQCYKTQLFFKEPNSINTYCIKINLKNK